MSDNSSRAVGVGRVLIVVYGILALAATGRSTYQLITKYDEAPLAYLLSALAAVVYILATVALLGRGLGWWRTAVAAVLFELLGVLVVGTLSLLDPELFPHDSVWSNYGLGYLLIPLVLPIVGLLWLRRRSPARIAAEEQARADFDAEQSVRSEY